MISTCLEFLWWKIYSIKRSKRVRFEKKRVYNFFIEFSNNMFFHRDYLYTHSLTGLGIDVRRWSISFSGILSQAIYILCLRAANVLRGQNKVPSLLPIIPHSYLLYERKKGGSVWSWQKIHMGRFKKI